MRSPATPPSRVPPLANTTPVWNRAWIAVALSAEIPDNTPLQVLVAGEAWVVTRMDGTLTAFEDRCPHRHSPLSAGLVTRADDGSPRLTCAVHGWRFTPEGQCDLIPGTDAAGKGSHSQDKDSAGEDSAGKGAGRHGGGHHHGWHGWHSGRQGGRHGGRHGGGRGGGHGRHERRGDDGERAAGARLRPAYGITERYGLVWLAVDEPLAPLPEFPEWADAAMDHASCEAVVTRASAGQVIDSLLGAGQATHPGSGWLLTGTLGAGTGTVGMHATAHLRTDLPHATTAVLISCQPQDWGVTRVYKLIARSDSGSSRGDPAPLARLVADESRALAQSLAQLEGRITQGHGSGLLPLDPEADPAPGSPGLPEPGPAPMNVAWRRLMARAIAGLPGSATPLRSAAWHTTKRWPAASGTSSARIRS